MRWKNLLSSHTHSLTQTHALRKWFSLSQSSVDRGHGVVEWLLMAKRGANDIHTVLFAQRWHSVNIKPPSVCSLIRCKGSNRGKKHYIKEIYSPSPFLRITSYFFLLFVYIYVLVHLFGSLLRSFFSIPFQFNSIQSISCAFHPLSTF